jgi:acetyltransferase-like isoleucine patch superfamily enzyme
VHETAEVSPQASIGAGTRIWHQAQVRQGACIGRECNLGKNVYVDFDVQIGDRVKVQNNASVYHGATIEDGVFIGPHVCLTNDKRPRAVNPDGSLQGEDDWETGRILIRYGAALGAGTIVVTGVTVGIFAMTGAGAVVTRDVPDYGLVVGNPAHLLAYVCPRGHRCAAPAADPASLRCETCGWQRSTYVLPHRQDKREGSTT